MAGGWLFVCYILFCFVLFASSEAAGSQCIHHVPCSDRCGHAPPPYKYTHVKVVRTISGTRALLTANVDLQVPVFFQIQNSFGFLLG